MNKMFSLLLLFGAMFGMKAQIPNADMEQWNNGPVLAGWQTNSYPLTLPPWEPYIVQQDTDHYSGTYSANFIGNGQFHSWGTTTFPLSQPLQQVSFYAKLRFPPCVNDAGFAERDTVGVVVEVLNNGVAVDSGKATFTNGWNNWTKITVPVSSGAAQFDSCRITLTGGKVYGGCGFAPEATSFKVDKFALLFSNCIDSSQICDQCPCPLIYDPVCGCNGVTYDNFCFAQAAGVTSYTQGACNAPLTCEQKAIVVQGVECPLLRDSATNNLYYVCSSTVPANLVVGDTVRYSYTPSSCISICNEGSGIDVSCYQIVGSNPPGPSDCTAGFSHTQSGNTVTFSGVSNMPVTSAWQWTFGNGNNGTGQQPAQTYATTGWYNVCLTAYGLDSTGKNCTATYCDTIYVHDGCIDSSQICPPGSLCCDAPLLQPVCGCDSVTYDNPCVASLIGGVLWTYPGPCVTTAASELRASVSTLNIWPNPATTQVRIVVKNEKSTGGTLRINNLLGEKVYEEKTSGNGGNTTLLLNTSNWQPGVYIVEWVAAGTTAAAKRLVIH